MQVAIVQRGQFATFDLLARTFVDNPNVRVVWRARDRRHSASPGARRAQAVNQYLVDLGVPATRITVVTKGKEQPSCTEESESRWQQNRRGHFIVTVK